MKSPFPGMDPYLERRWEEIHGSLIVYARDALNAHFGGTGLRAQSEQRLIVGTDGDVQRYFVPDVSASDVSAYGVSAYDDESGGGVATLPDVARAMVTLAVPRILKDDELRPQRYLEVRNVRGGEVVTVIEFVSPTNKRSGEGRRQFLRKRQECFDAGIHFVEIDLTRAGRRDLPGVVENDDAARNATYLAVARRADPEPRWEVYPFALRDPLPAIAIPLRPGDADLPLALQPLIDLAHERAVFDPFDYKGPLHPPLPPDDAAWAERLLADAGVAGEV